MTDTLEQIKWESLKRRRKNSKLKTVYSIHHVGEIWCTQKSECARRSGVRLTNYTNIDRLEETDCLPIVHRGDMFYPSVHNGDAIITIIKFFT